VRAAVRASTRLDLPTPVEVRSSPGLLEPGVVGLFRPILLLPEPLVESLTPSQLAALLAHELCHINRRDNLFASMHMIVEALFWFHPLVWLIGARLVEERERACDEEVLSLGNEPRIYADAILNVCRLCVESPLTCVSGVSGANLKHVKQRIEAIMTNGTGLALNRARKILLAVAGVAAVAGPVATGVAIGFGQAPAIRAQSPATVPVASPAPVAPVTATAPQAIPDTPQTTSAAQTGRMLAMLFDFGSMTADEQARARQSALNFVNDSMKPTDAVAVMSASGGKAAVIQDFTNNQSVLDSAILNLGAGSGAVLRLPDIQSAANVLAGVPGKKALLYFSSGWTPNGPDEAGRGLSNTVQALQAANVAIYPIDARGIIPQNLVQATPAGRSMTPQSAPAGVPQDEYDRRRAYVQEKFGGTSSPAMGRTYMRYGAPDTIDDRSSNAQSPSQIWRYNYLDNFHSSVEFEFAIGKGPGGLRINWPPPVTFQGAPGADATIADELSRELRGRGGSAGANTTSNAIAGLPGGRASFQTYPAGEVQTLSVPLDSLSGQIDVIGQIRIRTETGAMGPVDAMFRDHIQASANSYQTKFVLNAGSYVCNVIVREQSSGHMYGETIDLVIR
jgi:hypothetical protein